MVVEEWERATAAMACCIDAVRNVYTLSLSSFFSMYFDPYSSTYAGVCYSPWFRRRGIGENVRCLSIDCVSVTTYTYADGH